MRSVFPIQDFVTLLQKPLLLQYSAFISPHTKMQKPERFGLKICEELVFVVK
jgi:hypothetical protein